MEAAFWRARWAEHKIGFHEGHPNAFLEQHVARLDGRYRILVPLCGKSEDLAFLAANGHAVIGVELVEDAVVQFFAEHALTPEIERHADYAIYKRDELNIVTGDWFAMTPEIVGHVDGVYDRAAMIAMPPAMRPRYFEQLKSLVSPGAWGLVIGLEYDDTAFTGPPFPVLEPEVRAAYTAVEVLGAAKNRSERMVQLGIEATERCYAAQISAS